MLKVEEINTYYGKSHILEDVSIDAGPDQVVGIVGRNGVGKTTLLRSIMGIAPPQSGQIAFKEHDITHAEPYQIARLGIGYVPQERRLFPELTVRENIRMGLGVDTADKTQYDQIFELFPRVEERLNQRAGTLSGGEQQMVAMARALISSPELILLDEPTEGLMPGLIPDISDVIKEIAESGYSIILVEQNIDLILDLSDKIYVVDKGRIQGETTPSEVEENDQLLSEHLGINV